MTTKEIGEMIRTMRMSRGMSQKDLADATGISQTIISMYERGERRPKDSTAEILADVFNVPKWSIYYDEDEMMPIQGAETESDANKPIDDPETWIALSPGYDTWPPELQRSFQKAISSIWNSYNDISEHQRKDDNE